MTTEPTTETTSTTRANATFEVAAWEESVVEDIDGTGDDSRGAYYPDRGVTRATVRYRYTGDLDGEGVVSYLMTYRPGDAPVLGIERFTGSVGGREGTFVMLHRGSHDATTVSETVEVLEGMGTGALATLRGTGAPVIEGHSDDGYPFTLDYQL